MINNILKSIVDKGTPKPLAIIATGGGSQLGLIASIPGASQVLHSFYVPYAVQATDKLAVHKDVRAVSLERVQDLYNHIVSEWGDEVYGIAITAALTTNRYRKGEDHAFIKTSKATYHVKFYKITEEEYNFRDYNISREEQEAALVQLIYADLYDKPKDHLFGIDADIEIISEVTAV